MTRDFERALRALGKAPAPKTLAASVAARVGIGHRYVKLPSKIGDVYVVYGSKGVAGVRKAAEPAAFERWHARAFGTPLARDRHPDKALIDRLRRQIAGSRGARVQIDLGGVTPFERAVLEKAREIPRGEMRPYGWVARAIGHPRAVRAVGSALAKNPVPLLIPCHRVVRGDGSIGNYIFGGQAKRALLASEGAITSL